MAENRSLNFVNDLISGVVVFLVALPLCLGIALASGAPPESGLIAGVIGGLVVGLISGSKTSVSGPAAGLVAVVLVQIEELGGFEMFLTALILGGVLQIVLGLARAGFLSSFFPNAVISGLLAAIGIILILKQIPHAVGVDRDAEGDMSFIQTDGENTFSELLHMIPEIQPGAMLIGAFSFALLIFWGRFAPLKNSKIPSALVVVVLGVIAGYLFDRLGEGWAIGAEHMVQVPVAESFNQFLGFFRWPDFSALQNQAVYLGGVTIAIVASLETLLNLEATDKLDPRKGHSPPNRELLAQGIGNVLNGFLGGMPTTSVIIRSSVNIQSGARSKVSTVFHGMLLLLCFYFLPELLNRIPLSSLAAVLLVTGIKLANPDLFRHMWREGWNQFIPFIATIVAIVFTDLLIGILLGMAVSLAFILHSNFANPLKLIRENHIGGEVLRIVLANQVSFLNRGFLKKTLYDLPRGSHVLIDATSTEYIDTDVMDLITEFRDEVASVHGVQMSFSGFKSKYNRLTNQIQYVDFSSRDIQESMTPDMVLQVLKDGNERFRTGKTLRHDLHRQMDATKTGQFPLAVVLSCIDSRTPAEIVFDLGLGDIFSVRIAGNVAKEKVLGSMEFGCVVAGAKLIFVMGHTRCGAVTKAVELFSEGKTALDSLHVEHVDALLNEIQKSIDKGHFDHRSLQDDARRQKTIDDIARQNVLRTMKLIPEQSPSLAKMQRERKIQIVGGLYDVETGSMEYLV